MPVSHPLDWMTPKRNAAFVRTLAPRREAMYRAEIEERAGLLMRLCFGKEEARARLAARVRWDFEQLAKPPRLAQDVDEIVERVFSRSNRRAD